MQWGATNSLHGMPHQLDSAMMAAKAVNKQSAAEGYQTTPFTKLAQNTPGKRDNSAQQRKQKGKPAKTDVKS